jgi:hypothetical protein
MSKLSAAEILAKRGRTSVPERQEQLTEFIGSEVREASNPSMTQQSAPEVDPRSVIAQWKDELAQLPEISNFMLRVESDIKEDFQTYARKNGVTAETLLQGLWSIAKQNPQLLETAMGEAKVHHSRRTRASELKNLITRAEKTL